MKRILFFCMAALLAGIYTAHFIPDSISVLFLSILALIFLVLACFKKPMLPYFFIIVCFLAGGLYLQSAEPVEKRPMHSYVGEYVTIYGDVVEEPQIDEGDGTATIVARVQHLSFLQDEIDVKERVRLTVPAGKKALSFGDSFSAVCLLSVPNTSQNSGAFDYQLYLKSKQIFFTGRVERGTLEKTGTFPLSPAEQLYRLNRKCGQAISAVLPKEPASVLRAVALGDKSTMPDSLYDALKISGLSHMTAVSGMHVTTLLTAIYILLSLLKRNKYKFFLPVCAVILLFMLFTGASPSVVRATIMSSLALVSYVFYRKEDSLTSLGLSAGIIAAINPFAVFDVGFILSFGATLSILLFAGPLQERLFVWLHLEGRRSFWIKGLQGIVAIFSVTFSVQLFLLPILSVLFSYVSLWCFIANVLAAPVLSVLLVGGLLIGFLGLLHPWLSLPIVGFVYPFVKFFLLIVYGFGKLDFGVITLGAFSLFGFYLYGVLLISLHGLLKKQYRQMMVTGFCVPILLFCMLVAYLAFPKAEVTFINVGQGDCTLLQLPKGVTVLVDGGGLEYDSDYDVGTEVVLPYLQKEGIRKLTYMVASHPHRDHIGGLETVMEEMPVETLLVPIGFEGSADGAAFIQMAKEKGIRVVTLSSGDVQALGKNSHLEVLMPDEAWVHESENENDLSLVFRFCYGQNTVLFMGDLEEDGEAYLTERHPRSLSATILKAGHHGSADSTSEAFLECAKPRYVYIPCGKNHFGHPSVHVLARLSKHDATVFRADEDLDVTFVLNKKEVQSIKKGGKTP